MHPHFRVIPFFLVEFVMLVSVDTRLWFCMGSEFTSLTLTREPVLRIHLHEMIAIYSWLVTGQQWMEHGAAKKKVSFESLVSLLWEPRVNSEEPCTGDIH